MTRIAHDACPWVHNEPSPDPCRAVVWYGELILCFGASYRPPGAGVREQQLCYVRWLQTAAITAEVEKRDLTASEKRGPFEVYRWGRRPVAATSTATRSRARRSMASSTRAKCATAHPSSSGWPSHGTRPTQITGS